MLLKHSHGLIDSWERGKSLQKYKFQRQIILKNIIIVAAVIVALTAVAAGYTFAKVRSSFEEQMNVQMKGAVSQVDTALQLADEVALQLAANNFIINTFRDVQNYTYAGKNNLCKEIKELYDQGLVLPLCPEVLGGLPIPRTPCEVIGEKVIDQKGIDRTKEYTQGAKIALDKCLEKNIKIAVLKAKSPSCGKNHIYDGTFSHQLVEGDGIFVQVLKEKGIAVYSENEVTEVLKLINGGK